MRLANVYFIDHESTPNTWYLVNASAKFLTFSCRHTPAENELWIDTIRSYKVFFDEKMPLQLSYMELRKSDANWAEFENMVYFSMRSVENFIAEMERLD